MNFIAKMLVSFIAKNNIPCNQPFGNRQRLNITDAVVECLDHVYEANIIGSKKVKTFLDFNRAFDTANISIGKF